MKRVLRFFITILLLFPLTVLAKDKDITNYIKDLADTSSDNYEEVKDSSLAFDNTIDKNLRYVGKNPNNYIKFNNELWRIIGVVKTDDGTFTKIIKDESIGNYKYSETDTNWTTSNIEKYLNEDYYNALSEEAKSLITKVTWNTGNNGGVSIKEADAKEFYSYNLTKNTWEGYVGLIYPSDYIYATSDTRKECLTNNILDKYTKDSKCTISNYLTSENKMWTMTTYVDTEDNKEIFEVSNEISHSKNDLEYSIKPVVFLTNNIMVIEGSGEKSNPYIIKKYEENKVELDIDDEKVFTSLLKSSFGDLANKDIDLNLLINDNDNIIIEDDMIKAIKAGNSEVTVSVDGNIYILKVNVNPLSISVPDTEKNSVRLFMMIVVLLVLVIFELVVYIRQVMKHRRKA